MSLQIPNTTTGFTGVAQVVETVSGLCWDANLPFIGAQLSLQECNNIAYTQFFEQASAGNDSVVLALQGLQGNQLCVELQGDVLSVSILTTSPLNHNFAV
jgi:hypothetical protein